MARYSPLAVLSILFWVLFAAALPTALVEEPSRTVESREAVPDTLTDNIFAAAAFSRGQSKGFGGSVSDEGSCDLSQAKMPSVSSASTSLPSPSGTLAYVAIGRGTQNYTCDPSQPTASPTAIGAVANLYDASCVAGKWSLLMNMMPTIALELPTPSSPSNTLVSMNLLGHHYFTDPKSPTFNLDTANGNAGYVNVQSGSKVSAPSGAPVGQNGQGDGAVPWLSLDAKSGSQGAPGQQTFKEVYRVNTAGGQSPSTCQGMPSNFEVQYAAEYWFYK